jgi:AmmeMemoRadiSam system protein A
MADGGQERATTLIAIAREAIAEAAPPATERPWHEEWLIEPGATFVTLRLAGELRGCIGTIDPHRALGDDVAHNAYAAAYRDPRFLPVAAEELVRLEVEVSLLTARTPIACADEEDALQKMRPGVDGIYIEYGAARATFLPQVWENLPDPLDFLCELRRKAGLPMRFWHPAMKVSRYGVEKYK